MKTLHTIADIQDQITLLKQKNTCIGFIPTMGALHEGHRSLINTAHQHCDIVIVSIFVNPTQFAPNEDLDRYPRPFEKDQEVLKNAKVDILFAPTETEIYPTGKHKTTQIILPYLSKKLCGKTRPHFFKGVLMVVNRLFNIIQPTMAFFGEKDFQQLTIIKRMVTDLVMPIQIIGCPTIREKDGLAISSRNIYLSPSERRNASTIFQAMQAAKIQVSQGQISAKKLTQDIQLMLIKNHFKVDYVTIVDTTTLTTVKTVKSGDRILIAAYMGKTRLIDNLSL